MVVGIIFDFNGTMVFDSHLHEQAWTKLIKKYRPEVSEKEIIDFIHGRTNDKTIAHFIGDVADDEYQRIVNEKELEYQEEVRREEIELIDGLEDLLDYLVEENVPFTIATASPKLNVDFYFDYFKLDRWFDPKRIIFDDGTFPGKPEPDIYEIAAELLGYSPQECIVFEDAATGIQSANAAGIGQVYIMVSSDEMRTEYEESPLPNNGLIEDFNQVVLMFKDANIL